MRHASAFVLGYHGCDRAIAEKVPYVVGAIIDLGFCLDLLQAESIAVVAEGYKGLCKGARAVGFTLPSNKKIGGEWAIRRLDCAVINYVHQTRNLQGERKFDSVACTVHRRRTALRKCRIS